MEGPWKRGVTVVLACKVGGLTMSSPRRLLGDAETVPHLVKERDGVRVRPCQDMRLMTNDQIHYVETLIVTSATLPVPVTPP